MEPIRMYLTDLQLYDLIKVNKFFQLAYISYRKIMLIDKQGWNDRDGRRGSRYQSAIFDQLTD